MYQLSSSVPIYPKSLCLHSPRKFPLSSNFSLRHPRALFEDDPFFVLPLTLGEQSLGNLSSCIRKTSPSHFILCLIIALESWIEPHFSYSLLFEIQSVSRAPIKICRQFLWKTSSNPSSVFEVPMPQNCT